MNMTPRLRKFTLTAHVTSSVGWLGAVAAYLALAIAGLTSHDGQMVRAAFLAMELIGWFVIVPCGLAALLTGLVQSLGTEWGLFRHYWILAKFLLTVGGVTILLLHMPAVSRMAGVAAETPLFSAAFNALPHPTFVVHAGGGLLVLLTTTALSVFKPWGMTPYGRRVLSQSVPARRPVTTRKREDAHGAALSFHPDATDAGEQPDRRSTTSTRWGQYTLIAIIGLVLLLVVWHVIGGGLHRH
jgi:hypothetical protein